MRLYLVASTDVRPSAYRTFLGNKKMHWRESSKTTPGQQLIELAGRICYMSFESRTLRQKQSPKTNSEYVRHLILQGHESVLEHATYSIVADGITRGLSHQLVRHRVGFAYSQLSQQYHDERLAQFVEPFGIGARKSVKSEWRDSVSRAMRAYKRIATILEQSSYASGLPRKERLRAIRSLARTVLPSATSTTLMITGNARAWRHLLEVRGSIAGDFEMREFCVNAAKLLTAEAPDLFYDFSVERDKFGKFVTRTFSSSAL